MERVVAVMILVSGMVLFMALARRLSPRLQRAVRQVVFAVYLLGNLYVTLLSRRPEPVAHLEMELFSAYRNSFELDYGILGTIKRLLTEGFPAGIRLVTTEPLEGVILNILLYLPMGFLLPPDHAQAQVWTGSADWLFGLSADRDGSIGLSSGLV